MLERGIGTRIVYLYSKPMLFFIILRIENAFKKDGCEIQLDETTGRITVKGSQAQIQKLRVVTQDIVGRFGECVLNESKFSFLGTPKGLSQVRTLFPTENRSVEIVVNDQGNVMLYGLNKLKVQQAYDTIKNAIDELKLPPSKLTFSFPTCLGNILKKNSVCWLLNLKRMQLQY